jgi:hypothetical protein
VAVQLGDNTFAPLIIGLAPPPYAANVIGLPAAPLEVTFNCSRHVSPLLNPTDCPGCKVVAFTLAMVCQGSASVPGLESDPFMEST